MRKSCRMRRVTRGRARSCRTGEDRDGSGAADMMSLYTTVPPKGAGAPGAETEAARGPLPPRLADSHKAGAQFPSPLVGEDRLGRRPSEEGGAGHRAPGRSRPAVHQPQGQGPRGPSGPAPAADRLSPSSVRCSMPGDPLLARPSAELALPARGRRERFGQQMCERPSPPRRGGPTRAKRERGGDQPRSGFRRRRADEAPARRRGADVAGDAVPHPARGSRPELASPCGEGGWTCHWSPRVVTRSP